MTDAKKSESMKLLLRRAERLREELAADAPALIIENELRLIRDACSETLSEIS